MLNRTDVQWFRNDCHVIQNICNKLLLTVENSDIELAILDILHITDDMIACLYQGEYGLILLDEMTQHMIEYVQELKQSQQDLALLAPKLRQVKLIKQVLKGFQTQFI